MRKHIFRFSLLLVILLIGVLARIYFSAAQDWKKFQETRENFEVQVHYLDRVVRWYFPGNPLNAKAVDQLLELGRMHEEGNPEGSLLAYDSLRGALISTRHVFQPFERELRQANEKILELRSREHAEMDPEMSLEEARAFHKEALERNFSSDPFWSFVVELGFFAWLLSVIGWIFKGFNTEGVMRWRTSFPWILGIVVSFAIWIVGLLNA